jgi:tyrosinase
LLSNMNVQIDISNVAPPNKIYLTWAPRQATARLIGATPGTNVAVTLRSSGPGGQLVFGSAANSATADTLPLQLAGDGTSQDFFVAGKFGSPSAKEDDAVIEAVDSNAASLGSLALMVRIRKNANALSVPERDKFLSALGTLNDRGMGQFSDFRNMHDRAAYFEAHSNTGFLCWHRAYLLDLERILQGIDASVALPYWRFDQPAANVFTLDFMGVPNALHTVEFTPGHALEFWATDGMSGITRYRSFGSAPPPGLRNEAKTLAIGTAYQQFHNMESDPHNQVHGSFGGGFLVDPTIAPRDPLFFLLHGNVDRLWAKWQWYRKRFDPADPNSYWPPNPPRIGHNLTDTMWPWNGITGNPALPTTANGNNRPPTAPGGPMRPSPMVTAPPSAPEVSDMLDFEGVVTSTNMLGFDYDDVPFEP